MAVASILEYSWAMQRTGRPGQLPFLSILMISFMLFAGCTNNTSPSISAPKAGVGGPNNNTNNGSSGGTTCGDCGGGELLQTPEDLLRKAVSNSWEDLPLHLALYVIQRSHSFANSPHALLKKFTSEFQDRYQGESDSQRFKDGQPIARGHLERLLKYGPEKDFPERVKLKDQNPYYSSDSFQAQLDRTIASQGVYSWTYKLTHVLTWIPLVTDGSCPQIGDDHKQAWVTEHNFNARVCVDIEKLKYISPNALKVQLLSLWAHEVAHLLGFNETEAEFLQTDFEQFLLEDRSQSRNSSLLYTNIVSEVLYGLPDVIEGLQPLLDYSPSNGKSGELPFISNRACLFLGEVRKAMGEALPKIRTAIGDHQRYSLDSEVTLSTGARRSLADYWVWLDNLKDLNQSFLSAGYAFCSLPSSSDPSYSDFFNDLFKNGPLITKAGFEKATSHQVKALNCFLDPKCDF